jgi:hypothetical protein
MGAVIAGEAGTVDSAYPNGYRKALIEDKRRPHASPSTDNSASCLEFSGGIRISD